MFFPFGRDHFEYCCGELCVLVGGGRFAEFGSLDLSKGGTRDRTRSTILMDRAKLQVLNLQTHELTSKS